MAPGTKDGYLPVHCCCSPTKRLGWVRLPRELGHRGQVRFVIPPTREFQSDITVATVKQGGTIYTEVAELFVGVDRLFAVKSAHQPIDVWMQVPGFVPDEGEV
jgi:hypothetical protein